MVRLKEDSDNVEKRMVTDFNSNMVRLKAIRVI